MSGPARAERLLEDMDKLSRGWWPKDASDPASVLEYGKTDNVSVYLFDGATSWCHMMMTYVEAAVKYMPQSDSIIATNVRTPEMPKDSFIRSGEMVRRFFGRTDYLGVQGRIKEYIRNTAMLPVKSIWTALETKGTDEFKKPIYGPDFIGQALTGVCGPWFGNMLHLDFMPAESEETVAGKKIKVLTARPFLFTRPHIDPDDPSKIPYVAGSRVDKRIWEKVPSVMAPDLNAFYKLLDKLSAEAKSLGSPITQKETISK